MAWKIWRVWYWLRFWLIQRRKIRRMVAERPNVARQELENWDRLPPDMIDGPYEHNQRQQWEYVRKILKTVRLR